MQTRSLQVQMPGGLSLPLAFGMNTRRIGSLVRIQFGRSHRLMGSSASMVHISPCEATLGMIKGPPRYFLRGRLSISTAPYIREGFATAPSNQAFDRSRPRSQPELGSARPRSGRRDGTRLRIFGSGYHRNAGKQSKRGVPPNVIRVVARTGPASERLLSKFTPGAWLLSRLVTAARQR
jgi:hypothetical protein